MTNAGGPPRAPPKKENAAREKEQSEDIESEFVNDIVSPLVKFQRLRDSRQQVIDFQQRRAEKQDHEPGEQCDVCSTGHSSASHSCLSKTVHEQTAQTGFELA